MRYMIIHVKKPLKYGARARKRKRGGGGEGNEERAKALPDVTMSQFMPKLFITSL